MAFFLGQKEGMTQLFLEDGRVVPVTAVRVGPMVVTAVRTPERDGYSAVQVGFGEQKSQRISKSVLGHTKGRPFRWLAEFRLAPEELTNYTVGQELSPQALVPAGSRVKVTARAKGKGFQGVVKRWGFHGGPASHGQKHNHRAPGSIGSGLRSRVPKGKKMAGRMGGGTVTLRGLTVVAYDETAPLAYLTGGIPGVPGGLVRVQIITPASA